MEEEGPPAFSNFPHCRSVVAFAYIRRRPSQSRNSLKKGKEEGKKRFFSFHTYICLLSASFGITAAKILRAGNEQAKGKRKALQRTRLPSFVASISPVFSPAAFVAFFSLAPVFSVDLRFARPCFDNAEK